MKNTKPCKSYDPYTGGKERDLDALIIVLLIIVVIGLSVVGLNCSAPIAG